MAYKRYPPQKVPVNIWEFGRDGEMTDDNLVKITFENDEFLYVAWRDRPDVQYSAAWRVDEALVPENLISVRIEKGSYCATFSISEKSGFVGQQLRLDLAPGSRWRDSTRFITESAIRSIKPAQRPRKCRTLALTGKVETSTSNDYH